MTLLIAATLTGTIAGAQARHWPETPLITTLNTQARNLERAAANRCLPRPVLRWHPGYRVPAHMRKFVIRQRKGRLAGLKARRPAHEACPESYRWARTSAAVCVSSNEGGLKSYNPAGYYGRWQADISFQKTYGREFWNRHGVATNWPRWAQDVMGYRGFLARGWQPWPSTSVECGLR